MNSIQHVAYYVLKTVSNANTLTAVYRALWTVCEISICPKYVVYKSTLNGKKWIPQCDLLISGVTNELEAQSTAF